jgi:hypothetical protein
MREQEREKEGRKHKKGSTKGAPHLSVVVVVWGAVREEVEAVHQEEVVGGISLVTLLWR